jgi:exodeoxyribonuclease-3
VTEPFIFTGDLNTGSNAADGTGSKFTCSGEFEVLTTLGWIDAWRHYHSTDFEPTWTSNYGNGFRIDHTYVSPPLVARLQSCRYSHSERLDKISDHSILIVEIASSRAM